MTIEKITFVRMTDNERRIIGEFWDFLKANEKDFDDIINIMNEISDNKETIERPTYNIIK